MDEFILKDDIISHTNYIDKIKEKKIEEFNINDYKIPHIPIIPNADKNYFLVDKYCPRTISESKFHNNLLERLKNMSQNESIPHILLYGPNGSGKKTIIKLLLEMLYDPAVHNTEDTVYKVYGSNNKGTDVVVKQSDYHIVIEPNNNNFDRYLIQDIIKQYAKNMSLGVFKTKKIFRTVLINNVDNLSYYAQTSLRRTMEKYSSTCRFIMWCTCSTRVIKPLISRCIYITLNAPSDFQMVNYLSEIACMEKIKITLDQMNKIVCESMGNIKEALWQLELLKFGYYDRNIYYHTIDVLTKIIISHRLDQINIILKDKNDNKLFVRDLLYNIMITNIPGSKILKDIINKLCDNDDIPEECLYKAINVVAKFEHNIIRSRRMIMHIEAPIIEIMKIFYEYEKKHPEYTQIFAKYYMEIDTYDNYIEVKKVKKVVKKPVVKNKSLESIDKNNNNNTNSNNNDISSDINNQNNSVGVIKRRGRKPDPNKKKPIV